MPMYVLHSSTSLHSLLYIHLGQPVFIYQLYNIIIFNQVDKDIKPCQEGEVDQGETGKVAKRSRSFDESTKSSRLRRKSLDSPGSSEAMRAIVRLNNLEAKVNRNSSEGVDKGR